MNKKRKRKKKRIPGLRKIFTYQKEVCQMSLSTVGVAYRHPFLSILLVFQQHHFLPSKPSLIYKKLPLFVVLHYYVSVINQIKII